MKIECFSQAKAEAQKLSLSPVEIRCAYFPKKVWEIKLEISTYHFFNGQGYEVAQYMPRFVGIENLKCFETYNPPRKWDEDIKALTARIEDKNL